MNKNLKSLWCTEKKSFWNPVAIFLYFISNGFYENINSTQVFSFHYLVHVIITSSPIHHLCIIHGKVTHHQLFIYLKNNSSFFNPLQCRMFIDNFCLFFLSFSPKINSQTTFLFNPVCHGDSKLRSHDLWNDTPMLYQLGHPTIAFQPFLMNWFLPLASVVMSRCIVQVSHTLKNRVGLA